MSGANVDNVFDRVETKVKGLLDENAQLREQNRVLRGLLAEIAHDCEHVGSIQHLDKAERRTWLSVANRIKAALTATSQPGGTHEL